MEKEMGSSVQKAFFDIIYNKCNFSIILTCNMNVIEKVCYVKFEVVG